MLVRLKQCCCGVTVWLTGPPDAGTSPLAHAAAERLRGAGHRVAVLDADDVQRVGLTAEVLARNGVIVLVSSTVAPYPDSSDVVRERHGKSGTHFLHVHMATRTAASAPSGAGGSPHDPDLVVQAPA
ncbi:adenylyl-sulfate kinase [Streptomyces sp. NPDC088812]|uniref:adenylyl-sulfate kinase n=1 Tax=Streptomyces sp. NPDC088812 TaxID=3365905 RepID=UPI0037F6EACC